MLLGVVFPPGIGGVFAEYTESSESSTESAAESSDASGSEAESAAESNDASGSEGESTAESSDASGGEGESTTESGDTSGSEGESAAEPGDATEGEGEPTTEPGDATEGEGEPTTEPGDTTGNESESTEPGGTTEGEGEPTTEPGGTTENGGEPTVEVCPECNGENGAHNEGCSLYVPAVEVCPECKGENGAHNEGCSLYVPAVEVCPECKGENGTHNEGCSLYVPAVEVCPECKGENGAHNEGCSRYQPTVCLVCGGENGTHHVGCLLHIPDVCPVCGEKGQHSETCPFHQLAVCTCGSENGQHSENCPLYLLAICPECGGKNGEHVGTCSQYTVGDQHYPWSGMTDPEFAAWIMDAANAEQVKTILKQDGSEECGALHARIEDLFDGEELQLAQQVAEYLSALLWLDQVNLQAEKTGDYIYFDLAAGDVKIGPSGYSGAIYVNVNGTEERTPVTGTHADTNRYYIYQSTDENRATSGHQNAPTASATMFATTGSAYMYQATAANDVETGDTLQNAIVPQYDRVKITVNDEGDIDADGEEKSWTEYITNNTNVKKVSQNWDIAAAASGRTATPNKITFEAGGTYDATIDNIWSTYYHASTARITGGITAHLGTTENTNIQLKLKGDSRFCNIHYHSYEEKNNQIVFSNGDLDSAPGSVTVADFDKNWAANHWCSAIGGNDSQYDKSDGIVIDSGVIYAGTTAADNCTAIGGGGNEYGGVTINNGTVTAVAATTGTAIGGGIGWGAKGGDADVTINNGEVYAYNFGVDNSSSDKFEHYVPAVAIGGGSSQGNRGNENTTVTIKGGKIYAQCMGGAAIGGGGSASLEGGKATININGGTIIAKSTSGKFKGTKDPTEVDIPAGVSIGGGTGLKGGGSVTLNISGKDTILRTGSIGGGKATGKDASGNPYKLGNATVNVSGGNIIGQVVMAGGAENPCSFTMTDGVIHSTDVIKGVTIGAANSTGVTITDPNPTVPISFIENNGGAVWMDDTKGVATITGGLIGNCTANNGGAVYMTGGKFILSGEGELGTNHAVKGYDENGAIVEGSGNGGSVYVGGGTVQIGGGVTLADGTVLVSEDSKEASKCAIRNSEAALNGGGVYVGNGAVDIKGGSIRDNAANENGGGMYVGNGNVTLSGEIFSEVAEVVENEKTYYTRSTTSIKRNQATKNGGGMYVDQGNITIKSGEINYNRSVNGAGMYVGNGTVKMSNGSIHDNTAEESGGGMYVSGSAGSGNVTITGGSVKFNKATQDGGGMFIANGTITIHNVKPSGDTKPFISTEISNNKANENGGGVYVAGAVQMLNGSVTKNNATNGGGFHVEDGAVLMYGGNVDDNVATEKGGGMHVSTATKVATVDIMSGSVSRNQAKLGGGVSVVSKNNHSVDVTVGINCKHPNLHYDDRTFDSFDYPTKPEECGIGHTGHTHYHIAEVGQHNSCPQVKENVAEENGGGFFLDNQEDSQGNNQGNSQESKVTVYCMQAEGNTATNDPDSNCMEVRGGALIIGDEAFDTHVPHSENGVKGNTSIVGTIMVRGGQVDVYGEMENPKFINDVKVDVTGKNDHYLDHRIMPDGAIDEYKVHYYENFKEDDGTVTGLYIARQYPDKKYDASTDKEKYNFTVMASIFSRPGYRIVGWDTEADDTGTDYDINETYNLKDLEEHGMLGADLSAADGHQIKDDKLLILYAIWERFGYKLRFDPNVGLGETYTGKMDDQIVTMGKIDGTQKINKNQFKRPGYKFDGWTLAPTPDNTDIGDGKVLYGDEHAIKADFTNEDGAIVTLYAKWVNCTHDVDYLFYTANKNVLTQECSMCGGHTAKATILAENAVYDGATHEATVNFSENWIIDKKNWPDKGKPEIFYDMAADATWDNKDNFDDEWKATEKPRPVHAGDYTAKLTADNTDADGNTKTVTAQAEYKISPIKWETPAAPQINFDVQKVGENQYKSTIRLTVADSDGKTLNYWIKRFNQANNEEEIVGSYTEWQTGNEFTDVPFGDYYYFYVKQVADRDHLESDPSKSDAYLADGGNIVLIKKGPGIKVVPSFGDGKFTYTVSADDGYHLRNYQDNADKAVEESHRIESAPEGQAHNNDGITVNKFGPTEETYTYEVTFDTTKVAYWQVTLEFSGAAKDATVTGKVMDGQVFRDFNGKETSISRDSAFTAQFTVSDYFPDEYGGQELKFSQALPIGTTIIMKTGGKYWYYTAPAAVEEIDLNEFTTMGGSNKFIPDTTTATVQTITYQFIVDFSNATSYSNTGDLNVSFELAAKPSQSGSTTDPATNPTADSETNPTPSAQVSVAVREKATFDLSQSDADVDGKSVTFDCTYTASDGAASIWNGRKTALVLTATEPFPPDLMLTAVVGNRKTGSTMRYVMNVDKKVLIPLGEISDEKVTVTITLSSNLLNSPKENPVAALFGLTEGNLEFTADWCVAQGNVDQSPLWYKSNAENLPIWYDDNDKAYKVASCNKVAFPCRKDDVPSLRIDGSQRLCHTGDLLNVTVKHQGIPSGSGVIAYLQKKDGEQYVDTGANKEISNNGMSEQVTFNMGQMGAGSYRILVIVKKDGANMLQVPYYFVIQ